jgi:hypothetical protein
MAEDGESDKLGSITKSFDQYEYVAIIIPGALLLFGLVLAFPDLFPWKFEKDVSLGTLGLFLVAAFIMGQLLHAAGDLIAPKIWRCWGGMPTEWILPEAARPVPALCMRLPKWTRPARQTLLDPAQQQQLLSRLRELLNAKPIDLNDYAERLGEWQAITRRVYAMVSRAKLAARIDVFNRTLGMMIGIAIALLILGVVFLIRAACGTEWPKYLLLAALAFVMTPLALARFRNFGILYGRELFVQFIDMPAPPSAQGTSARPPAAADANSQANVGM